MIVLGSWPAALCVGWSICSVVIGCAAAARALVYCKMRRCSALRFVISPGMLPTRRCGQPVGSVELDDGCPTGRLAIVRFAVAAVIVATAAAANERGMLLYCHPSSLLALSTLLMVNHPISVFQRFCSRLSSTVSWLRPEQGGGSVDAAGSFVVISVLPC